VGYFRSSIFAVVGPAVIEFARRGGRIELICSPDLDPGDVEHIALGYARREQALADSLVEQFDALLSDPRTNGPARTLATLIAVGTLELKLAERTDRRGIYHEKIGLFSDTLGNVVSFKGSANETWHAWHEQGNFESIEVFCSWRGGLEEQRVRRHSDHFSRLWDEIDPDIAVFPFPPSAADYFKRFAYRGLDELMNDTPPGSPKRRDALPHQQAAIDGWIAQGRRGILQHATGSGKTFTAILAIRAHVSRGLPTLVLVPSRLLLTQWEHELRNELPEAALLLAGAQHDRWRAPRRLRSMTDADPALGPRITLATMQTGASDEFRQRVSDGSHLLIVADEVHQIGSPQNGRAMEIDAGFRLGLSATPTRFGDPDGTTRILNYFGGVVPPPVTLMDAVSAGRLVPYEYHPHPVNLTASEADDWRDITKAIRQEVARQGTDEAGSRRLSERAKMLLIRRSRIAKKAAAKVKLALEVLTTSYELGQSWLVYCEDGAQLADIIITLREAGLEPVEYRSGMAGDRDATMDWFKSFGGILVSIRCLDEGVDIPAVSHALILASSQNPRQFIQRRGRVLRKSHGKHLAVIHDAIVVPVDAEAEPEQTALLKAELVRALEFANYALNSAAGADLRAIAISMGIDPDTLAGDIGEEEDYGH
jgi:superfamily II DNA or RNA helicase